MVRREVALRTWPTCSTLLDFNVVIGNYPMVEPRCCRVRLGGRLHREFDCDGAGRRRAHPSPSRDSTSLWFKPSGLKARFARVGRVTILFAVSVLILWREARE